MLEPAWNLMTQIGGMIFGRPSVQLVPDVSLVHQHGDNLGLPRPSRTRGDDFQLRIDRGHPIKMAWMAIIENDAGAAGQTSAESGGTNEDQHRDVGFDA